MSFKGHLGSRIVCNASMAAFIEWFWFDELMRPCTLFPRASRHGCTNIIMYIIELTTMLESEFHRGKMSECCCNFKAHESIRYAFKNDLHVLQTDDVGQQPICFWDECGRTRLIWRLWSRISTWNLLFSSSHWDIVPCQNVLTMISCSHTMV